MVPVIGYQYRETGEAGMNWPWKKQKKAPSEAYDREKLEPVIRSSICTGEKVAGFREKET